MKTFFLEILGVCYVLTFFAFECASRPLGAPFPTTTRKATTTTTKTTTKASTNISKTYPIVDTGLSDCSSAMAVITCPTSTGAAFYGQDAQYSGNQPSYRNNGDGTITDLVTGLMWQRDMGSKQTYSTVTTAVKSYSAGGYSDWRIPNIKELYSLILFSGETAGAITAGSKRYINTDYFVQPIGNTSAGEREIDAQTFSSTAYTGRVFGNQQCYFGVNFIDGRIKCYPTNNKWYFRYVRGSTNYGLNNFQSNGDNTVTDSATGLMWQQQDSGNGMNWQNALSYCERLSLASHTDWRLPNAKELQSIVDYTKGPQTTGTAAINSLFGVTQITEPDGTKDYPYYWSGTTHKDGNAYSAAAYVAFGQAWGKPDGSTLMDVHGAGAQRSDPKSAGSQTYPQYLGPQGDLRVVYNYVRCVRNA